MIVYCSDLPNDQDMIEALGSVAIPIPIPHGDVAFIGIDDNGEPLRICVERKKVPDMVSCVLTDRYLNQVQLAKDAGFQVFCLILEGRYRPAPADGLLEIPGYDRERDRAGWKPTAIAITFSRLDQYLTELQSLAGIIVKHTENVRETAAVIKALWTFYQKSPDDHQSLKKIYKPKPPGVLLSRPSFIRRVAAELKGVGWEKSKAIVEHFSSVREMVNADEDEWMKVPGVGKKMAREIVASLQGRGTLNGRSGYDKS